MFERFNKRNCSLVERIYFLQGKKSYENISDFTFTLRYISAMFFNYERNIYYIYIFKYVKHFSFFLSFNLASQMEKRATKRTIEEYLTFDLFFPFPKSASFAAIMNVLLVRFDTPLTYETPIFLELSTYFLYI